MHPLSIHILLHSIISIGISLMAYYIANLQASLIIALIYLITWLGYHLYHIQQLYQKIHSQHHNCISSNASTFWAQFLKEFDHQQQLNQRHRTLLRQTLIRFQAAAQILPNGIMLLNRHKRIDWLNHTALNHLNLNPQNTRGNTIKKILKPSQYQALLNNNQPINISVPQSNGMNRYLRLISIPFSHQSQLIISEDITNAEQLNTTRTTFVANVSHELRTPLTVINGFLETLADHPTLTSQQQQQFISLMQHETQRMLNIINDLLTLSTLENFTEKQIELTPLNLSELCEQIHLAAQNLSGCQHNIQCIAPKHIMINAHARDLYQALSNLVFNAVRYTPTGGNIQISLTLHPHPNPYKPPQVRFAVCDDGVGIAAEHLPHITNRFYRVDQGRSRESGGTGLGLAIAKHALANHGALLEIQSELGKGSEFSALFDTLG